MPKATELSLDLKNETGTLARLCRELANGGVNLLALLAPEAGEGRGTIKLLVANRDLAERALSRAGYTFAAGEVVFLEMKNRPGALAKAVEKLARAKIDVRYAYATAHTRAQKTAAAISVDGADLDRAVKLLG
jgi:hypothetical protein